MSPTFRLAPEACLFIPCEHQCGWCAKGRLEVRERELKLRCHVPVGVLKSSHADHVDTFIRATDSG
jgi:hypothetical protein